jgi:hypothetical protein
MTNSRSAAATTAEDGSGRAGPAPPGGADHVPREAAHDPLRTEFEELYRTERPAMVRLAYLLTGSPSHAEAAAQEAFIRVLERWDRLDTPASDGLRRSPDFTTCCGTHPAPCSVPSGARTRAAPCATSRVIAPSS